MMYVLLSLLLAVKSFSLDEKPLIIAVVDTGYTKPRKQDSVNLCKQGHKDFSGEESKGVPEDTDGHGTNIAHIIDDYLKKKLSKEKYCLVIVKYTDSNSNVKVEKSNSALRYVLNIRSDFVNYSGGGNSYSSEEAGIVKSMLNFEMIFVAAAGNEGNNLEGNVKFYPAMADDRIIVVGALNQDKTRFSRSNYGSPVDKWEVGVDITAGGHTKTGTSQSTALATAKIVYEEYLKRSTIDDSQVQYLERNH